jgi:glucans biosynthesis protein C
VVDVLDTHRSLLFTAIVLLLDVPLMPVLFFVAGYFALPSLQRRGTGGFIREKVVRLPGGVSVDLLDPRIASPMRRPTGLSRARNLASVHSRLKGV